MRSRVRRAVHGLGHYYYLPTKVQMDSSPTIKMSRFGPRWWLLAGIVFFVANLLLSPITLVLFGTMVIAAGFSGRFLPVQWFWAGLLIVIVPGTVGFGGATRIEALLRRANRPDRAKRWGWRTAVTAIAFLAPFLLLPAIFVYGIDRLAGTKEEQAARVRDARRPIVASDSIGFCSEPTWRTDGHVPVFSVAVRVAERDTYALMVQGMFNRRRVPSATGTVWVAEGVTGMSHRELGPGVDTMTVRLDGEGTNPPTGWPVCISNISLSYYTRGVFVDARSGESLYVIDSTGARPRAL